ncbi:MAG: hypothetical protein WA996_15610 [Candidatus Promineifilaceae bacterium]
MHALARLRVEWPQARFLLVGFASDIRSLYDWIAATDVLINLRHPTMGETSGLTLRGPSLGKPVVVVDDGWCGELPENVNRKVALLDEAALLGAMRELAGSASLRAGLEPNAVVHVKQHLDLNTVAKATHNS